MDGTWGWGGWWWEGGELGQRLFNVNGPSVRKLLISTRPEVASSQLSEAHNKSLANNGEIK